MSSQNKSEANQGLGRRIFGVILFTVSALLLAALSNPMAVDERDYPVPPSVNLNAIHLLKCTGPDGDYIGSGFLIAKGILVTANHVGSGNCVDANTHTRLRLYKVDKKHDLALMTGKEPTDEPYINYTCARPRPNKNYLSYGISSYGFEWGHTILRSNVLGATSTILKDPDAVEDLPSSTGMRLYHGAVAPGMSGGPVIDPETGYAYALNNAGDEKSSLLFDFADTILCQ